MTFDLQTILIVAGILIGTLILLWLLLGARRRQSLQRTETPRVGADVADPYAVSKERPYMAPPAADEPPAPAAPAPIASEPEPAPEPAAPAPPEEDITVPRPAVPLGSELVGIAFPAHSTDHPDPLTRLKGVGPKLEALLNDEGVTRYEQLASLNDAGLAALEERLGSFKGRLTRDRVVEQARLLASGDTAGFEEKFGKLGS